MVLVNKTINIDRDLAIVMGDRLRLLYKGREIVIDPPNIIIDGSIYPVMPYEEKIGRLSYLGISRTMQVAKIIADALMKCPYTNNLTPDDVIHCPERFYVVYRFYEGFDFVDVIAFGAIRMRTGQIMHLYTFPQYRRKGYMKRLIKHMVEVYKKERDGKTVFMWVKKDNYVMHSFCKKYGFKAEKEKDSAVKYVIDVDALLSRL